MEATVEDKLKALFKLQQVDSKIDRIRIQRGELPMEVGDLEDEVTGLDTRLTNIKNEVKEMQENIATQKLVMKEAKALIKKYEAQQMNVKNNREYDALTKEVELQKLEIQGAEKKIKYQEEAIVTKSETEKESKTALKERKKDLEVKNSELAEIITETEKEEKSFEKASTKAAKLIEERLLTAYHRIRKNAKNGLAVVPIDRDACGGCFNKIPPQRQLDLRQRKKIIVCEHCGRILVDGGMVELETAK
ncbi:hypothetical protein JYT51_00540 [Candidatus Amoebophilus asiaticus]|nr:hypothetical protein [Candidatus Amoebophilus asiaticus]